MCEVVNVRKKNLVKMGYKDFEDWLQDENNVYIGRRVFYVKGTYDSKWRNKFSAKKYGREKSCEMFIEDFLKNDTLFSQLRELRGKKLGCWCKPENCHGDFLAELVSSL